MKQLKTLIHSFSPKIWILLGIFILIGCFLRVGLVTPHEITWSYDQARDSFLMRSIVANRDIILVGPQTEFVGLSHGPLYYYLFASLFSLSNGETLLPMIGMSLLTFSSFIPLVVIAKRLSKSTLAPIFVVALTAGSYAWIEYGRWLSNVSISLPLISWSYFVLYEIIIQKKKNLWLFATVGVCIGLSIQSELFLLSYACMTFLALVALRANLRSLGLYCVGLVIGVAPLILAEIKFQFLGARTFIEQFLGGHSDKFTPASFSVNKYLDHLGMTMEFTIAGISAGMGLLFFVILFYCFLWSVQQHAERKNISIWLSIPMLAHAILFTFHFVDAVFINLLLYPLLVVMMGVVIGRIAKSNKILAIIIVCVIVLSQSVLIKANLIGRRPFAHYGFIQKSSSFTHKEEIVRRVYELTEGQEFTFGSIGTPFGVRTVWASVFELYAREHGKRIPKWFGYNANGYPGEKILDAVDRPAMYHVLIKESQIDALLPSTVIDQETAYINSKTVIVTQEKLHDTSIEIRKPIEN